jgi:hypothetical protein
MRDDLQSAENLRVALPNGFQPGRNLEEHCEYTFNLQATGYLVHLAGIPGRFMFC